jgi:hypothetical protein
MSPSPPPLILDATLLLGEGTRRKCFAHPSDPALCIKIPLDNRLGRKQQRREISYYKSLQKRNASFAHIIRYYGPVSTSLGPGSIYEAIRDSDGTPSKSLWHYLTAGPLDAEETVALLLQLGTYLVENRILFYDANPTNIAYQKRPEGARLVIFDGIGDTVFFPISNYVDLLLKRKVQRRWNRAMRKMKKRQPWLNGFKNFKEPFRFAGLLAFIPLL